MTSYVPPGHEVWETAGYGSEGPHLTLDPSSLGQFFTALLSFRGTLQSLSPPLSPIGGAWVQAQITLPPGGRQAMLDFGGVALYPPSGGFSSASSGGDGS